MYGHCILPSPVGKERERERVLCWGWVYSLASFTCDIYNIYTYIHITYDMPAMVALSHPCSKLPIEAAMATRTAPCIFAAKDDDSCKRKL